MHRHSIGTRLPNQPTLTSNQSINYILSEYYSSFMVINSIVLSTIYLFIIYYLLFIYLQPELYVLDRNVLRQTIYNHTFILYFNLF